jgi:hypothetical protein
MFRYFFWTTLCLLLSGGVFVFTITQLDPLGPQGILALTLFFASLLGSIWSIFTYIFFFGAELMAGKNLSQINFKHSLRRGFLFGLLLIILVVLRLFNLLGWTEGILLTIFFCLVELIFSMDSAKIPAK